MTDSTRLGWKRACVQIYTGDGKGKTTAALGLALRALGAGRRVCFLQFAKGRRTSETAALARFGDQVQTRRFGRRAFIVGEPTPADLAAARRGLVAADRAIRSGEFDLVVLDEANVAVALGLIEVEDLLQTIRNRPRQVELVITGRDAHPRLLACADLVTEMRAVRHYFARGVMARMGIEH